MSEFSNIQCTNSKIRSQDFEQSAFAREAGAAVHLAPNANGILRRLGINAQEFGANEMERVSLTCKHPGNSIGLTNALT